MSANGLEVAQRLVQERERLGLSRVDFAAAVGVHRNTQANYEKGERVPDAAYLEAAKAVGVNIDYVLHGDGVGRERLIMASLDYESELLADVWLVLAAQLEQSMLDGGAVAGVDYGFKDLWQLTQPLVVARLGQLKVSDQ